MKIGRPRLLAKLVLLTVVLAALPASALAASFEPARAQDQVNTAQGPFGGTFDVQPGAVNGQVTLEPGSVSVQAMLRDPGVDGQLQVNFPGTAVGSLTASNGRLSYDVSVCGARAMFSLSGTSTENLHVSLLDTSTNPAACTSAPPTAQGLVMRPLELAAQAQPSGTNVDVSDFLANWGRRLVGFSLVAILLVLLIPGMPRALDVAAETSPWARIGIGIAVGLILPLIGILVFAIGLPVGLWWLGVILLALYPVILIVSMSVSGLALGSWLNRRVSRPGVPILVVFAVGMLILTFVSLLPFVGPIVTILALIFGLGTLVLAPRSKPPAVVAPPAAPDLTTGPATSAPVAA